MGEKFFYSAVLKEFLWPSGGTFVIKVWHICGYVMVNYYVFAQNAGGD